MPVTEEEAKAIKDLVDQGRVMYSSTEWVDLEDEEQHF